MLLHVDLLRDVDVVSSPPPERPPHTRLPLLYFGLAHAALAAGDPPLVSGGPASMDGWAAAPPRQALRPGLGRCYKRMSPPFSVPPDERREDKEEPHELGRSQEGLRALVDEFITHLRAFTGPHSATPQTG